MNYEVIINKTLDDNFVGHLKNLLSSYSPDHVIMSITLLHKRRTFVLNLNIHTDVTAMHEEIDSFMSDLQKLEPTLLVETRFGFNIMTYATYTYVFDVVEVIEPHKMIFTEVMDTYNVESLSFSERSSMITLSIVGVINLGELTKLLSKAFVLSSIYSSQVTLPVSMRAV